MKTIKLIKKEQAETVDVTIGRLRTAIMQADDEAGKLRALALFEKIVAYMDSVEEFLPVTIRRGF